MARFKHTQLEGSNHFLELVDRMLSTRIYSNLSNSSIPWPCSLSEKHDLTFSSKYLKKSSPIELLDLTTLKLIKYNYTDKTSGKEKKFLLSHVLSALTSCVHNQLNCRL